MFHSYCVIQADLSELIPKEPSSFPGIIISNQKGVLGLDDSTDRYAQDLSRLKKSSNYRTSEHVIDVGERVLVLGNVNIQNGIHLISKEKGPLVISTKPEKELKRMYTLGSIILFIFGALFLSGGAFFVIAGALS